MNKNQILSTNKTNCKDCHKCIRHCPVNAIKFSDGHAQVDPERCILDGNCYKICPQKAKCVISDVDNAKSVIKENNTVIASIAPSFFGYYDKTKQAKIITALNYLGFDSVEQTSRAAEAVAYAHLEHYKKNNDLLITSSCPSSVMLIEKYYPDLLKYLAPIDSPVLAHYKILKQEIHKPFKMIFIGPCIAKKKEIEDSDISVCLTFEELEQWIEEEQIDLESLPEGNIENYSDNVASLFPLLGGLIKTAGINDSNLDKQFISVSGIDNIKSLLESIRSGKVSNKFIEILACEGGCLMGPARPEQYDKNSYIELRETLIDSTCENHKHTDQRLISPNKLQKQFDNKHIESESYTEEQIKEVLASIGKQNKEDEHNCGACGYDSCREKAKAVLAGMAEKEMCIPYMRSQAERFAAIVLEATPNSVVIIDRDLNIIEANPAFTRLFGVSKDELKGKHISEITDDEPFKQVLTDEGLIKKSITKFDDKTLKRLVFSVQDKKLITGIFVDITDAELHKEALKKVKNETLERAQKVIDKQMFVAQEVAGLLGETTAETKVLLGQLVKILKED